MPKAFSDQKKEAIRTQMLEKGKKLFEKQGLKKTSVDEITETVGISKGAFYIFYESKEELFLEVLEQIEDEVQTAILEFAIKPSADAKKNVSNMLNGFLLTRDDYPLLKNLNNTDLDHLARKVSPERLQRHAQGDKDFINGFVKKIRSEGISIQASPKVIDGLIKSLFFVSLHREDMGEATYQNTMNVLVGLVAGYIVGE